MLRALAAKYANVMQGVDSIMRGPIIETKAKKAWNAGMQQGMQQGIQQGMQQGMQQGQLSFAFKMIGAGLISIEDAAKQLGMSKDNLSKQFAKLSGK